MPLILGAAAAALVTMVVEARDVADDAPDEEADDGAAEDLPAEVDAPDCAPIGYVATAWPPTVSYDIRSEECRDLV